MIMERVTMRKIREILRLRYTQNLSTAQIGRSCNLSKECTRVYLKRAKRAGLTWPLPEDMDDLTLEHLLFKQGAVSPPSAKQPMPDLHAIHQELKKKGVTLSLLWDEYKQVHPEGFQYSRFCELYRKFKSKLHPTMRQTHVAGEKLFVDFSGLTIPWTDPQQERSMKLRFLWLS